MKLQKPCFLLFSNGSCVNILDIRLAHLMIKNVAVTAVMTPDQALGDAGNHVDSTIYIFGPSPSSAEKSQTPQFPQGMAEAQAWQHLLDCTSQLHLCMQRDLS